jgi:elongation factor 1-gamma
MALSSVFGWGDMSKETQDYAVKQLKDTLKVANKHLEGKTYLVGSNITLADFELFAIVRFLYTLIIVEEVAKNLLPNVTAWFHNLASNEHLLKTYGRSLICKVPQKAPKIDKPKEEPKKKEEPKPKAEKEAGADGDDDETPKKKKINPLDTLPPSTFVLDDWKREFLNAPDRKAVMDEFWGKYDPTGYSLWWMQYQKLPSEGKILFKTNNSSNIFLQQCDTIRKYTFATHGVYGEEGNYDIRGVWMWRGTDIPQEVKFCVNCLV